MGGRCVYDATGVSAKLHRLRGQREHLAANTRAPQGSWPGSPPPTPAMRSWYGLPGPRGRARAGVRPHPPPEQGAGLVGGTLGGRPGRRRAGRRSSTWRIWPPWKRAAAAGATPGCPGRSAADRRGDPAPGRQARHRGGHRPGPGHLQILPPLRDGHIGAQALPGPRPACRAGLEVGVLPGLRPVVRPGLGGSRADRRPWPARPARHPHPPHHRRAHHRHGGGGQRRPRPPARKPTRAARRARRTRTDLHPRPAARDRSKNRPTPKRPTRTSARVTT